MREVDVAIIGAGTAGLSARSLVALETENYVLIDPGPLGTTCARVGCMPSKVLIQVAQDFHRRHKFATQGISGAENLQIDHQQVMKHVRSLRDRFVRGVLSGGEKFQDKILSGKASFLSQDTLKVGEQTLKAKSIIVATGSSPFIPQSFSGIEKFIITSDQFFELESLPQSMAVVGLGVIGLEIGQALSQLDVEVTGITRNRRLGALSDPTLQNYAFDALSSDFPILEGEPEVLKVEGDKVHLKVGKKEIAVEKIFMAAGRVPNLSSLQLEKAQIQTNQRGVPIYDASTMQIPGTRIFIAGDVNADLALLHEAADEGRIAGYNTLKAEGDSQCFKRRELLAITFSDPNIAIVGKSHQKLLEENISFVHGEVCFEGFGRAIVKLKEKGLLHIYAKKESGQILGAEMIAPDGEHLAHLLSWIINLKLTVHQVLSLPFYHPVMEEALRKAFRDLAKKINHSSGPLELMRCQDPPAGTHL